MHTTETEEEFAAIGHLRGYCHDSKVCPLCVEGVSPRCEFKYLMCERSATLREDPYDAELYGEHIEVWICDNCHYERAQAI